MDNRPTVLERAFALAEDGTALSLVHLRYRLAQEGFSTADLLQLQGRTLTKQIQGKIASARAAKSGTGTV
jgi:hypothetical protein